MRWLLALAVAAVVVVGVPGRAGAAPTVADGFRVERFAEGIPNPTNVTVDDGGVVWVTSASAEPGAAGYVWRIPRGGGEAQQVIGPLNSALGLTWFRGKLYVSDLPADNMYEGEVTAYWGFDGEGFAQEEVIVSGIPTGIHRVDSVIPGPDGRLYLGVGSQEDRLAPTDSPSAAVISFRPDGSDVRVEAEGLRNPYGLSFIPGTSRLLVTDQGIDFRGDLPPDELNYFDVRKPAPDFGFPGCWDQGGSACAGSRPPAVRFTPHSAASGVAAVRRFGRFGPSAFVAQFGSTPGYGSQLTGSRIVRVSLRADGSSPGSKALPFADGFAHPDPLGIAAGPDSDLYVTLWSSGEILRFSPEEPSVRKPQHAGSSGRLSRLALGGISAGLLIGLDG